MNKLLDLKGNSRQLNNFFFFFQGYYYFSVGYFRCRKFHLTLNRRRTLPLGYML